MLGENPTMIATVKIQPSVIKGLSCSTRLLVLWRQLDSDGSGEVSVEEVPPRRGDEWPGWMLASGFGRGDVVGHVG